MEKNYKFNVFKSDKNLDLTIYQYGWERCKPLHSYGPAKRNHYLFHFVFSGRGILSSNDTADVTRLYHIEANQGFLICPGQINTYSADEKNPWEYAWIEFDGVKALEYLESAGLSWDAPIYKVRKREQALEIKEEMMAIVNNVYDSPVYQIGHLFLFLDALIRNSLRRKTKTHSGNLKDAYIREAISFIETHYAFPITIEDVANYCNLNRNYLNKLFKEGTSHTLQHFLMYYRMNQAAELLKLSDLTVNEVGKRCGYQNQLHFSRAFKNIFGCSPLNWRRMNKKREDQAAGVSEE